MTLPTPDTLELLARLALVTAGFLGYALLAARWQRRARRDSARLFEQLDLALMGLRDLADSVAALESQLRDLAGRLETQGEPPASAPGATRNYEIAVRMARNGAPAGDLAANCGLTPAEAALLARLHGPSKAPAAPRAVAA